MEGETARARNSSCFEWIPLAHQPLPSHRLLAEAVTGNPSPLFLEWFPASCSLKKQSKGDLGQSKCPFVILELLCPKCLLPESGWNSLIFFFNNTSIAQIGKWIRLISVHSSRVIQRKAVGRLTSARNVRWEQARVSRMRDACSPVPSHSIACNSVARQERQMWDLHWVWVLQGDLTYVNKIIRGHEGRYHKELGIRTQNCKHSSEDTA